MIRTEQLSFAIGRFHLRKFTLELPQGQYFVLLGPPGSGKTIFLECLCGLKRIDSGRVYIAGKDVTALEPRARSIGYVPQDYALFPHLSVEQNIAFGLRARRNSRCEIAKVVAETSEMLDIKDLLKRRIEGLSGGEKQRTALARALVIKPRVLLLDEPVCALDESTRQKVCALLRQIQHQFGVTTIHVSHNLEEAFSVADRAAVMNQGYLQQIGSLDELLRKPKNEFVARFMRCENIFTGQVITPGTENSPSLVKLGDIQLQIPGRHTGQIKFMIRPEDVLVLSGPPDSNNNNQFNANLVSFRDYGSYVRVELDGRLDLTAHMTHAAFAQLKADESTPLNAVLLPQNIHVLKE